MEASPARYAFALVDDRVAVRFNALGVAAGDVAAIAIVDS